VRFVRLGITSGERMSASRKPIRKPGKKSGARINNCIALRPLGTKVPNKYELSAYAALFALNRGAASEDNLVSLYVLADMAERIGGEVHIQQHSATVKRLIERIYADAYRCDQLTYQAMRVSVDVLLSWVMVQQNMDIAMTAREVIREIDSQQRGQANSSKGVV
jgi:hypothetical protein